MTLNTIKMTTGRGHSFLNSLVGPKMHGGLTSLYTRSLKENIDHAKKIDEKVMWNPTWGSSRFVVRQPT